MNQELLNRMKYLDAQYAQTQAQRARAPKPKGNQLLKTLFSIGGGTAGAILGTIAAPGFGTALGGALGSGLGTFAGRAAGGESLATPEAAGEVTLDALLGGAFSGFGKAAKAAKLGGTALGVGGKELAAQTAKGLGESAGKEAGQTLATKAGKLTGQQALESAQKAVVAGRPKDVFGKAALSLQRAGQKELGFQEAAKLGGQKISAQQGDTLYNFLVKDLGIKGTEKISPGKALRAVENAQQSLIGSLEKSAKETGYVFSSRDAQKIIDNARKAYGINVKQGSATLKNLESNVFNAIKDNTFEGVDNARKSLDAAINRARRQGASTPWMEDVANSLRRSIDERLTQISGVNKDIKTLYQRTANARELLQGAQTKEVAGPGNVFQFGMRAAQAGRAALGTSPVLQKTLQTLSTANTVGGRLGAGVAPTVLSQAGRQTGANIAAQAIGGQPQPTQDMQDITGGGMDMTDTTGMMGGATMEDMGQQSQIDQYFQGLVLQDLQQTGGKRLSAIKAAYDIFGGGAQAKPSAAQIKAEQQTMQVQSNIQQLGDLYQQAGGGRGRVGGLIGGAAGTVGLDQPAYNFNQFRDSMLAPLARAISGEVGVLTDRDIKRADGLLPKLTDSAQEAATKLRTLNNLLSSRASINQQVYSRGVGGSGQSLGDVLYNFPG